MKELDEKELEYAIKQLYYWKYGNGTNFHSMLYTLFQKADPKNLRALQKGYGNKNVVLL